MIVACKGDTVGSMTCGVHPVAFQGTASEQVAKFLWAIHRSGLLCSKRVGRWRVNRKLPNKEWRLHRTCRVTAMVEYPRLELQSREGLQPSGKRMSGSLEQERPTRAEGAGGFSKLKLCQQRIHKEQMDFAQVDGKHNLLVRTTPGDVLVVSIPLRGNVGPESTQVGGYLNRQVSNFEPPTMVW
jgi:hypothetical protein